MHSSQELDHRCRRAGVETEYWDIWGNHHSPAEQVKQAILQAIGGDDDNNRQLPPVMVASANAPLPLDAAGVEIDLEDGGLLRATHQVPAGYHRLRVVREGSTVEQCHLIVTPDRAWFPPCVEDGGRLAGVAVSLYGVRSARNWGCGDFTDLERLLEWLHEDLHCAFIALNPLHAIENRQPYNTSPYLPSSAFFRNALYVDVERVPEFSRSHAAQRIAGGAKFQSHVSDLRNAEFVEYEPVWRAKRFFLRILYREFLRSASRERKQRFAAYRESQGERLTLYATYCALWNHLHRRNRNLWIWQDWPAEFQQPDSHAVHEFQQTHRRSIEFHAYMQWVADEQLEACQTRARAMGMPVGIYHDMALAIDKCGADLWAYRDFYVHGCRVGSPPDGFSPDGQDWAFPPPDKRRLARDGYRFFADLIRANSRHGGALRMDHVMRLFRLFWIPDGYQAKDGTYVRDAHEDLLRILALESHRGHFFLVGEDLGTVPHDMRDALDSFGILGYKVFFFEKDWEGRYRRPDEYPRAALVASTTHDLPTLAGFWTHRDIEARRAANLLPDEANYQRQLRERASDKQRMLDMLHDSALLPDWFPRDAAQIAELSGEMHNAIIGCLVRTPSMLMVLNQEDLTKETEQQNLPASTWQYPNWRRKMKYSVEELRSATLPRAFAEMFRNWLKQAGRTV
ncbi:MAG: 4-alpha-glucanotransferase [Candidatus Solibacter usitatus]|nr:4-alpha-glucanotransferase [Candidatus Solibacter usitatus]